MEQANSPRATTMKGGAMEKHHDHKPYLRLAGMTVLSFIAMYILMYAMVNVIGNVYNNINQVYMAGLMASPMVTIELILMRAMYPSIKINQVLVALSIVAMVIFLLLIREQVAVTNNQFLRSMIPHHSGAILMCEKAPIQSEEIKGLCRSIIASQEKEIRQMKALLDKQ